MMTIPTRTAGPAGALALLLTLATGCGDETTASHPTELAVPDLAGDYDDGFAQHHIGSERWRIGSDAFLYSVVDNDAGVIVARNALSNAFSPGKWSRFDWTTRDGHVWYCQIVFDAARREDALSAVDADPTAPADGGCAGFPWSTLVPLAPAIEGDWNDGFADHTLAGDVWTVGTGADQSLFHLVQVDNAAGYAVAQNDDANAFSPGLWSRFDWTHVGSDLFYCQTVFDAPTRAQAALAEAPDATSPAEGGCGGFPWSLLSPR